MSYFPSSFWGGVIAVSFYQIVCTNPTSFLSLILGVILGFVISGYTLAYLFIKGYLTFCANFGEMLLKVNDQYPFAGTMLRMGVNMLFPNRPCPGPVFPARPPDFPMDMPPFNLNSVNVKCAPAEDTPAEDTEKESDLPDKVDPDNTEPKDKKENLEGSSTDIPLLEGDVVICSHTPVCESDSDEDVKSEPSERKSPRRRVIRRKPKPSVTENGPI